MDRLSHLLEVGKQAAAAGANELTSWSQRFTVKEKSRADLVTDADFASQKAIRRVIDQHFPGHGFLGEESPDERELSKDDCWIVDPLDGTTNYVHGFPCYAVSVAYAHQGKLEIGVILDPNTSECFTSVAGEGSQLNDVAIAVSSATNLSDALVAVSLPPRPAADSPDIQAFLQVTPRCQAVRRTGSAALNLAYVACGRLDAHWAHYIHPWDSAAGVLLVTEAGGTLSAYDGQPYDLRRGDYFVACTPELRREIAPLLIATYQQHT